MIRSPLRLVAALALVALTLFVVACGGDDASDSGSSGKASNGSPTEGKKGGKLEQLGASDVDFLDPGQTYYTAGYEVVYVTQRPLYSFKPGEKEAQPDLAEGDPRDLRRQEDRHGDAQEGRQVRASGQPRDPGQGRQVRVRAGVHEERSEPVHDLLQLHRGRPKKSAAPVKEISGIQVDETDPYKITFKLTKAQGVGFAAALVMPITMPVPKEYAEKFDKASRRRRTTRTSSPRGPYMVENDAQGKVIGYKPASRSTSSATPTGTRTRTSVPRTWTRS